MNCARSSASSLSDSRFTGRDRGVACLQLELHAAVRPHAVWSFAQYIALASLERGERGIVGSGEVQLSVGQAEGHKVKFRAVLEYLYSVGEVVDRSELRWATRAPPGASRL
jgi:hypothetical protein